jgi:plasmid stability protein
MATLHIRNVPEEVVVILKRRAALAGRSLNAEVVRILSDAEPRPRRSLEEVLESVRRRAERMNLAPDVADDVVESIRRARDERAAQIERLVERRDDEA